MALTPVLWCPKPCSFWYSILPPGRFPRSYHTGSLSIPQLALDPSPPHLTLFRVSLAFPQVRGGQLSPHPAWGEKLHPIALGWGAQGRVRFSSASRAPWGPPGAQSAVLGTLSWHQFFRAPVGLSQPRASWTFPGLGQTSTCLDICHTLTPPLFSSSPTWHPHPHGSGPGPGSLLGARAAEPLCKPQNAHV